MNTRIICLIGDEAHPADEMRTGIDHALRAYDIDYSEDAAVLDGQGLDGYSLMVLAKSGMGALPGEDAGARDGGGGVWLTQERDMALLEFVREGGGLLIIHSGLARQESERHRVLAGGCFLHHPPECELTITSVNNHPISAGVTPFTLNDEQYFCSVAINNTKPILASNSKNGAVIAGWTHTFGVGRICALTPGHSAAALMHPQMVRLIRNAAAWCAAGERR